MRWVELPITRGKKQYFMCPLTGALLEGDVNEMPTQKSFPKKLEQALHYCDSPYSMITTSRAVAKTPILINREKSVKILVFLCRFNFLLARKFASFLVPSFVSSRDAIAYFNNVTPSESRDVLCLPRSLFAANTSNKFKDSGIIFIGVFMPSRQMHAWIIEDGQQVDPEDNIWHLYQPVAALC